MNKGMPAFFRQRRWWLLPLLIWAGAVGLSLRAGLNDLRQHNLEVASEGIRNVFHMVLLTRAWNAEHGHVYVPITEKTPPNPYLEYHDRDVTTTDGQRLTMINPAYMTRQLAELAFIQGEVSFHITSLDPIRPANAADAWEAEALALFERGVKERIEVVSNSSGGRLLRYMAPLAVTRPCLSCHAKQGYMIGDVRGGVSVSLPYDPIEQSALPMRRLEYASHGAVFLLVALLGWLLLELLRRRWLELADNIAALEVARNDLETSNRSLAQARDEAESASRAKSTFLNTMSHELRTPLNAILGMTELLRVGNLKAEQRENIEALQRSGKGLLGLVNEVLDFTRMESSPIAISETVFEPARLLDDLAHQYRPVAEAKSLRLEAAGEAGVKVAGDYGQIRRILANLIDNAIKFTDRGGVSINATATPASAETMRLRFEVRDSGIGMTADTVAKLFRPFEIADATTTRRHGGVGLGLAIAHHLATRLGGRIEVDSRPGAGSRFVLWLDLAAAANGIHPGGAPLDIARLLDLLEQDDLQAAEVFAEQSGELSQALGGRFEELAGYLAGYRYAEAADLLRTYWHDHPVAG